VGDSPGCLLSVYAFAHNLSLVIDSLPLLSWPSGAKHAGSLYGGSHALIADGLEYYLKNLLPGTPNFAAPYNDFCMP
jgi:hypothetical protein